MTSKASSTLTGLFILLAATDWVFFFSDSSTFLLLLITRMLCVSANHLDSNRAPSLITRHLTLHLVFYLRAVPQLSSTTWARHSFLVPYLEASSNISSEEQYVRFFRSFLRLVGRVCLRVPIAPFPCLSVTCVFTACPLPNRSYSISLRQLYELAKVEPDFRFGAVVL